MCKNLIVLQNVCVQIWKFVDYWAIYIIYLQESCPADREIITHYQDKVPNASRKLGKKAQLMEEVRTFSIPPEISNGAGGH